MSRRPALLLVVLSALVAPTMAKASPPPIPRSAADTEAIRKADEATRGHFKVGVDDAVFRKVVVVGGGYVCGQVSVRSGPYMRFVYTPASKGGFGMEGLNVDDGQFTNAFNFVWNGTCPAR